LSLIPGQLVTLKLRLTDMEPLSGMDSRLRNVGIITSPGRAERAEGVPGTNDFDAGSTPVVTGAKKKPKSFTQQESLKSSPDDAKAVMRQCLPDAVSKQFYHTTLSVAEGDPARSPATARSAGTAATGIGCISTTTTFVSMPDKWEYPWYAAWDLAFHCISTSAG